MRLLAKKSYSTLGCVALACMYTSAFHVQAQDLEVDWDVLERRDVIVKSVKNAEGVPGVRAFFIVNASREKIWETLVDYDNFPKIFKGIDKMRVIDGDANGARVEFWVDAVVKDLHYVLHRQYTARGHRLTWKKISGDLKDIQGSWQILDTLNPETKLLIYDSYVDIGSRVATWAVRLGAKRKARKMARRLRNWIEKPE